MVSLDLFLQAVVYGLIMGSIYALTSSGLTLILGVLKIINVSFVSADDFLVLSDQKGLRDAHNTVSS